MFSIVIDADTELRLLVEEDTPTIFYLTDQNRAYLREWLPWVDDTHTAQDTLHFISASLRQYWANNGFSAGIWHSGALCGVISYNYIDHDQRQTELGYWLGARYQGKGLVTAACRAMTSYAFDQFHLQKVEIRCAVDNVKSRAVPLRLDFVEEGIVPQLEWLNGRYVDVVIYSITADVWRARLATIRMEQGVPRPGE